MASLGVTGQSFVKTFSSSTNTEANYSEFLSPNEILVVGSVESSNGDIDGLIMRFDTLGNLLASETVGGSGDDVLYKSLMLTSGGYIVVGQTTSYGNGNVDFLVLRFDSSHDLIWSKAFGSSARDRSSTAMETSNGEILIGGWTEGLGVQSQDILILKIDINGELLWGNSYGQSGNDYVNISRIVEKSNGNYLIPCVWSSGLGIGGHNGAILELNSSGSVIDTKLYGGSANDALNGYIEIFDSYIQTINHTWSWDGRDKIWMNQIDENGDITWSKTYGLNGENLYYYGGAKFSNNGDYIISSNVTSSTVPQSLLMRIDESGNLIWTKSYDGTTHSVSVSETGSIYAIGFSELDGQSNVLFIKSSIDEDDECGVNLDVQVRSVSPSTYVPDPEVNIGVVGTSCNPSIDQTNFEVKLACGPVEVKALFEISDDTICVGECVRLIDHSYFDIVDWFWYFVGADVGYSELSDPGEICFNQAGSFEIKLIVTNDFLSDTLSRNINVVLKPEVFISDDTLSICNEEVLTLYAETENVEDIIWSTGEINSTIVVNSGGDYWVTGSNACSLDSDSIFISQMSLPKIDLGSDTVLCEASSLILQLAEKESFEQYVWNTGEESSEIEVSETGLYTLQVSNYCGEGIDSINVEFFEKGGISIPNVFTPNNDGFNEQFILDSRLVGAELHILNRSGVVIFESHNYQNDWSGDNLNSGIYYYYIIDKCGGIYKGWLHLIK